MEIVTILDTETTGLDPKTDAVIEVAAVQYHLPTASVLSTFATVLQYAGENKAEYMNRIPSGLLSVGAAPDEAWAKLSELRSDAVLAHNSDFDRSFVPATVLSDRPWIDTYTGVSWVKYVTGNLNLVNIALNLGVGVVDAHRALSDCMLLARILTQMAKNGVDLNDFLASGLQPRSLWQACVDYNNRNLAKTNGFRWDGSRWVKKLTAEEAKALPFKVDPA